MPVSVGKNGQLELFVCNCKPPPPIILDKEEETRPDQHKFTYPKARRDYTLHETFHGLTIVDPYRWLEDEESPETKRFIEEQNQLTMDYLSQYKHREEISNFLLDIGNMECYSNFSKNNMYYFYDYKKDIRSPNVIYIKEHLDSPPEVFLYSKNLPYQETSAVTLSDFIFSPSGNTFVYIANVSPDMKKAYFIHTEFGILTLNTLENLENNAVAWTHDNNGVFYTRRPMNDTRTSDGSKFQQVFYHQLGTTQSNDIMIYTSDYFQVTIDLLVSDCGTYFMCMPHDESGGNIVLSYNIKKYGIHSNMSWDSVVSDFEHVYTYVTTPKESINYFVTNSDASNNQLIMIDFEFTFGEPDRETIIPEHSIDVLTWALPASNKYIVVHYVSHTVSVLKVFFLDGELAFIITLEFGTVVDCFARRNCTEMFFKFESITTPTKIYRVDFEKDNRKDPEVLISTRYPGSEISGALSMKQIFYRKHLGMDVPMTIIYKSTSQFDGNHPCLLTCEGGFNSYFQPKFHFIYLAFILKFDGIVAMVNIRGGGEYGFDWYNAGRRRNKQNCFDDFQLAAKYLCSELYTSPNLLVVSAKFHGALVNAVSINQHPELFACCVCYSSCLDMLRYHHFIQDISCTHEFGIPEIEQDFRVLLSYSPYHNTYDSERSEKPPYPSMFLVCDDVAPEPVFHSLKMAAQLQHITAVHGLRRNPILLRYYHLEEFEENSKLAYYSRILDILCFIARRLKLSTIQLRQ